jgi:hypothetical protein
MISSMWGQSGGPCGSVDHPGVGVAVQRRAVLPGQQQRVVGRDLFYVRAVRQTHRACPAGYLMDCHDFVRRTLWRCPTLVEFAGVIAATC